MGPMACVVYPAPVSVTHVVLTVESGLYFVQLSSILPDRKAQHANKRTSTSTSLGSGFS
jgi:hypothetical protein